jgi:uncharacterized membrane protein (Fun14 family)
LSIENLVFSAGGGFLFGTVAGYALKKVMKIAAIVIGLFVIGLSYLSYSWWIEMENATKTTLTNVAGQAVHALTNTASQFAAHSRISRFTYSKRIWVHARSLFGLRKG